MSSKIEQLIEEMEEYIDSCKPKFMSSTEIIVNKDEIEELLRELRMKTPEELKLYQRVVSNKEAILNDARTKAEAMINEATAHTSELVSEHEIMQQAYEQANGVVNDATLQAQEILDKATMEANELRMAAMQYMDDMLAQADELMAAAVSTISGHCDEILSSMNHYRNIIQSNRSELAPAPEMNENMTVPNEGNTAMAAPASELPQAEPLPANNGDLDVI